MSRRHARLAVSLVLGVSAATAACSSSSNKAQSTDAGADALGPASDAAFVPIGSLNGDGATGTQPQAVMCGSTTCKPPASMTGIPLGACCLPDNSCGSSFMLPGGAGEGGAGTCLNTAAGSPDTSCPSQTTMGMMLTGCCSVDGVCGVDLSMAGLGCNSLSAFGSVVTMEAGPPQACGDGGTSIRDAAGQ